jgi:transposase
MATIKRFSEAFKRKHNRIFSEDLKRQIVKELDLKKATVAEISRRYGVSDTSIYNWVYKYSTYANRGEKVVIEKKSEARKVEALEKRIAELERAYGQKQMELEIRDKMIEIAEKEYKVDIKKKFSGKPSCGFGVTEVNTDTK